MRAEQHRGFVLPIVLGLLLVAGIFAATALADATLDRALATTRLLHQRAFEAAERGVRTVFDELANGVTPVPGPRQLPAEATPTDSTEVTVVAVTRGLMPEGYSAGRFIEQVDELRSIGRSARNTQVIQVQGLRSLQPQDAP
jgi:Tfp pilus assembly protein PilX